MASPTTGKFTIARGSNSHIWAVCEANGRFHLNGHFAGRFDEASGHVYDAKDQVVGRMQKLNPNCKDLFDRTGKNCFGTYVMNWQGRKPNQRPDGATVKPGSGAFSAEFNQNGAIYLNGQDWGVLNVCGSDEMEECFPAAAAISIYFGEHFLIDLQTQVAFADAPTVPATYTAPAGSAAPAAAAPAAAAAAPAAAAGSSPTTGKFIVNRGGNAWAVIEDNGRFHIKGSFAGRFDEASGHVYDAKDQVVGRLQKLNPNCKDLFDRTGKNCFGTYVMNWQGRKPNQRPDGATIKPSSGSFSAELNQNGAIYVNGNDWGTINIPGSEDMEESFPSVAAVAIYFGDHFLLKDLQTQVAYDEAPTQP